MDARGLPIVVDSSGLQVVKLGIDKVDYYLSEDSALAYPVALKEGSVWVYDVRLPG